MVKERKEKASIVCNVNLALHAADESYILG